MEKLYRKKKNGRYEEVIGYTDTLSDGIWLVQTKPYSRSLTSLLWKVGDLKRNGLSLHPLFKYLTKNYII
jgi:hypothetical protein